MKRTLIFVAISVLGAIGVAWIIYAENPIFVLKLVVSTRSFFTHIEPNHAVAWNRAPRPRASTSGKHLPNAVVILADDLGFNDLTFKGGGVANGAVPTPNIDGIARDGVTLTSGYAGDATCAPSRAAIMTGRYATRFGFEFTPIPLALNRVLSNQLFDGVRPIYHEERENELPGVEKMGLPPGEVTIAQLLRTRGYHTVMLGKWHLGENDEMRPDRRGFDEALTFLPGASLYLPTDSKDVVNARIPPDSADQFLWAALPYAVRFNGSPQFAPKAYMTDYLADEAVRVIDANKDRPFFMYLAFNAPHTPLQALKSDYDALPNIQNHRLRVYAAMIRALDRGVGRVLAALKERGLEDNTLVVFTSDNGGAGWIGLPDVNKPYRGWKMTFFEGGIHVPFFMKWPSVLSKGSKYNWPVGHVDIFATAAAAAGARLPTDRVMDGVDLLPYLSSATAGEPHKTLFWRSGGYWGLIDKGWKLQTTERPRRTWLFNLDLDATERHDLSTREPKKLAELLSDLHAIDAKQAKPLWPSILEGPVAIDHPLGIAIRKDDEVIYWAN